MARHGYEWISFTTDYGDQDGFTAACRGVIARIAPDARVLDVTHGVPPQDVGRGAAVLAQTIGYLPPAVHLAVVDPGVGTDRRGVAVLAGDSVLVGPDNGLLVPAATALGGPRGAYELTEPGYRLPVVSRTFHGRDVFAPAAAHLAAGVPPERLGPAVDPATLARLPVPVTRVGAGMVDTEVATVDRYGNVQLDATAADLARAGLASSASSAGAIGPAGPDGPDRLSVHLPDRTVEAVLGEVFADAEPGRVVVLVDSAGRAAVAVRDGSAAARLRLGVGDRVRLEARGGPPGPKPRPKPRLPGP
ncbi:MAG TPA: SAM-dependent chlorinase/fluorinase [Mycobacteriales bacterium]|nr:SAM-dependent chlorinase/fluorinase [Mycobacteriales bacterium]